MSIDVIRQHNENTPSIELSINSYIAAINRRNHFVQRNKTTVRYVTEFTHPLIDDDTSPYLFFHFIFFQM